MARKRRYPYDFSPQQARDPHPDGGEAYRYPPHNGCLVDVLYVDGQTKTFICSASPRIAAFLGRQMGETGVLTIRDDEGGTSVNIMREQVAEFTVTARPFPQPAPEPASELDFPALPPDTSSEGSEP